LLIAKHPKEGAWFFKNDRWEKKRLQ